MFRAHLRVLCVLALLFGAVPAALAAKPTYPPQSPFFLPRELMVGSFLFGTVTVPQIWLKWEAALYQQRVDTLMFVVEGGGGYATHVSQGPRPQDGDPPLSYFYEHSVTAELGYRMDRTRRLHAGPSMPGAGPLWSGRALGGSAEGELHRRHRGGPREPGWHLGPVTTGITAGSPRRLAHAPRSYSAPTPGGFLGGCFT